MVAFWIEVLVKHKMTTKQAALDICFEYAWQLSPLVTKPISQHKVR